MTRILRLAVILFMALIPTGAPAQTATPAVESPGWWTSWSTCEMTPIQTTPWEAVSESNLLHHLPWFEVDLDDVTLPAHLFFGNRPLPIGNTFPGNTMYTKVLWTFSEPVRTFDISATLPGSSDYVAIPAIETGPANTSGDTSTDWPSYLFVPATGCWQFDVDITTAKDATHHGSFVFIAVE